MKKIHMLFTTALFGAVFSLGAAQSASANVADDLNANYNNIVNDCGGADKPGFLCSGNIIRSTYDSSEYHTWDPSSGSITRGGVSFMYFRKDIHLANLVRLGSKAGVIYFPYQQQPATKKMAEVSCIFPTDGWTINRPYGGCGATTNFPTTSYECQQLGIYTADDWYTHYTMQGISGENIFQHQCAFDVSNAGHDTASALNEAIKAQNKAVKSNSLVEYGYPEMIIKTWPTNSEGKIPTPSELPIQAFFYVDSSSHVSAKNFQTDYYNNTGIVVPIVKLSITGDFPKDISYSYNEADQKILTVADKLNAQYNNTVDKCGSDNNPAYQCSGILLRQVSPSNSYKIWDPSSTAIQIGGSSFSYMRKDIQFKNLMKPSRNSGFIYYPTQFTKPSMESAKVSCSFPVVGWSSRRAYGGCGPSSAFKTTSAECQQQGINTADEWDKHFSDSSINTTDVFMHQCAFDVSNSGHNTANAFMQSITAHNQISPLSNSVDYGSNEIVVKVQETDTNGKTINPEKLPLQAFFYNNTAGLTEAQSYQQDYYDTTNTFVPVVYMNVSDLNNISFEYKEVDQVVNRGVKTAAALTTSYNKVVDNCGSESSPAFACSGNIIRFTNYSTQYHVWDPSPAAAMRKGISFMYIRHDLPLDKTFKDKGSGLIYYPTKMLPASKELSSVRCAFPVDGYSDRRYTNGQNDACGANINYPNTSQPCQEQGITTGQGWYTHFSSIPDVDKNRLNHQCGFSLANTEQNQASIFKAALDGQKLLQDARGSASYNELVLTIPSYNASYQIDNPAVLPIEAFFYTNDSGLTEARGYQQDYHDYAHVDAPIVKLDLDVTTGAVTYSYNKTDQTDAYNQAN